MASFAANPFAQYSREDSSVDSGNEISVTYYAGIPSFAAISDPNLLVSLKSLLKRDSKTLQRGLLGTIEYLHSAQMESQESLAKNYVVVNELPSVFCQVYAKLSIDNCPDVRRLANQLLGELFFVLKKKSQKYLRSIIGLWLAATHDPDSLVAETATFGFSQLFDQSKQMLIKEKMRPDLIEFVMDVVLNQNAATLSDPRNTSNDDARFKYDRLLCSVLDLLSDDLLGVSSAQIDDLSELLNSVRFWKICGSRDPHVAGKVLSLGEQHTKLLAPFAPLMWQTFIKQMQNVHSSCYVQLLRTLIALEFAKLGQPWTAQEIDMLTQLVCQKDLKSVAFWQTLYSLILSVSLDGISRQEAITKVCKSLSKVLSSPRLGPPSEQSAWGCFTSLALKSELQENELLVLKTMVKRFAASRIVTALLRDLATNVQKLDAKVVCDSLVECLSSSTISVKAAFIVIISYATIPPTTINNYNAILNQANVLEAYTLDPNICLPMDTAAIQQYDEDSLIKLLKLCKNKETIESIIRATNNQKLLLSLAPDLGLVVDSQYLEDVEIPTSPQELLEYVLATYTFVDPKHGSQGFEQLLKHFCEVKLQEDLQVFTKLFENKDFVYSLIASAEQDDQLLSSIKKCSNELLGLAKAELASDSPLKSQLSEPGSWHGILACLLQLASWQTISKLIESVGEMSEKHSLEDVIQLASDVSNVWQRATAEQKKLLCLDDLNWVPQESVTLSPEALFAYKVRWRGPEYQSEHQIYWKRALYLSIYVLHLSLDLEGVDVVINEHKALEVHIASSAARGHLFSGDNKETLDDTRYFLDLYNDHPFNPLAVDLSHLANKENTPRQFHLAQIYYAELSHCPEETIENLFRPYEQHVCAPSLFSALYAKLGDIEKPQLYQRFQKSLYHNLNQRSPAFIDNISLFDATFEPTRLRDALIPAIARESGLHKIALLYLLADVEIWCEANDIELDSPDTDLFTERTKDPLLLYAAVKTAPYNCCIKFVVESLSVIPFEDTLLHDNLSCALLARLWPYRTESVPIPFDMNQLLNQLRALDETDAGGGSFATNYAWAIYIIILKPITTRFVEQLKVSAVKPEMLPEIEFLLEDADEITKFSQEVGAALYIRCVNEYTQFIKHSEKHMKPASIMFANYKARTEACLRMCEPKLKLANVESLEWNPEYRPDFTEDVVAGGMLYRVASNFGSTVTAWYRNLGDKALTRNVLKLFVGSITPVIVADVAAELAELQKRGVIEEVSLSNNNRDLKSTFEFDNREITISISLPDCFPLKQSTLELKGVEGIPITKTRSWQLDALKSVSEGRVVDALLNVRGLIEDYINGIEPCVICYAVMLENKSLPRITCSTCSNKYHSECLHEWFTTSKAKSCPMCRSNM